MKKVIKVVLIFLIILSAIIFFTPERRFLESPTGNGKYITIYHPLPFTEGLYIIPEKYSGFFAPSENYVKITPTNDQILNVNWEPNDGYQLKIELPSCDQPFINKFDSNRYQLFIACSEKPTYIDSGESYHFPKYSGYTDWTR